MPTKIIYMQIQCDGPEEGLDNIGKFLVDLGNSKPHEALGVALSNYALTVGPPIGPPKGVRKRATKKKVAE